MRTTVRLGPVVSQSSEVGHEIRETYEAGYVATQRGVPDELHEVLVIVVTYTIGDPRAVMVHFEYASATNGTVMRAFWFKLTAAIASSAIPYRHIGYCRRIILDSRRRQHTTPK